ncbi:MAG: glutathione synthase [Myxococcales bacterium]|nr:glutathione synthase [Myxococcales bacterium]MDH5307950.1 glutathione synthase [Myxococcales bacterium]MDH5566348.1 glutathione synthase [Myxococcales bacterium]
MTTSDRTFAFVMDPIESIDIRSDTTFVLMLEAQRRGHRVLYIDPADLGVDDGVAVAQAQPVTLRREEGRHADLGAARSIALDDGVDVVLQRKDPPVDAAYVTATQILSLCRRALVLNRPEGILAANEKLYAQHHAELMPPTRVTRSIPQLLDFMAKLGGEMVVKPLDGRGGEGIFHVRNDDRNLLSILEQSTRFQTVRVMAQQYLPEVRQGDKRILLLDGEPLGAVMRVPAERELRANLHVGGRPERTELDDRDRHIIECLAPRLRRDGLFFVGIDVIGGRLTEVNLTSPTGVQEINALEDRRLEAAILDGIEAKLTESALRT